MPEPQEPSAYQLRAFLLWISPIIWRRILVRGDSTIADQLRPEELALTPAEAKGLLEGLRRTVVERQIAEYSKQQSSCPLCDKQRLHKRAGAIVYRTLFGNIELGCGAHLLLQVRTQMLNEDIRGKFEEGYPGFNAKSEDQARAARLHVFFRSPLAIARDTDSEVYLHG
jgi:hypothetical protein